MENPIRMDDLGVPLFSETSKYFLFSPRKLGKMIQFDAHIFQMGWFNHQLVILDNLHQIYVYLEPK